MSAAHQSGRLTGANLAGFVLVSLIWGSTWLVIRDQVSSIPPGWTVAWRFVLAGAGMFALAIVRRDPLLLPAEGMVLAGLTGLTQFVLNYQFVYRAEHYVTSGLVAVVYGLLMLPNAVLARIFLGTRIPGRFLAGSTLAVAGIALLVAQEYRVAPPQGSVLLGIGFTVAGMLGASLANVLQASRTGRSLPVVPLVAWSMTMGAVLDVAFAWWVNGPPVLVPEPRYWAGVAYLAVAGSVITFPLYFNIIRAIGAGRAAYTSVVVPVIAMGLSTLFEGYRWSLLSAGGSILVLCGMLIALSRPKDRG